MRPILTEKSIFFGRWKKRLSTWFFFFGAVGLFVSVVVSDLYRKYWSALPSGKPYPVYKNCMRLCLTGIIQYNREEKKREKKSTSIWNRKAFGHCIKCCVECTKINCGWKIKEKKRHSSANTLECGAVKAVQMRIIIGFYEIKPKLLWHNGSVRMPMNFDFEQSIC